VTENLQKQIPAYEKNRPGAAVDLLWNKIKELSGLMKEGKLDEAKDIISIFKEANLREFTKENFEGEILATAKNTGLVEQVVSKTFDWKARDQAKKENKPLMEKPQDFEFQYRHWETDPKTERPILQIDLYRFVGNKGSAAQKDIFNELKHYSRFIEPLGKIANLREDYQAKRETLEFRKKMGDRLSTAKPVTTRDFRDQAADIGRQIEEEEKGQYKKTDKQSKNKKLRKTKKWDRKYWEDPNS